MAFIRAARPQDAAAIALVHVGGWRSTYRGIVPDAYLASLDVEQRTIRWQEILSSPSRVLVAEHDERIIGFASGGAIREPVGECDAELYAIYLDSHRRRNGIGTALLKELARCLNTDGFTSLAVWVLDANAAAAFYEQSGARRAGSKNISVGGTPLPATAYAWPHIQGLLTTKANRNQQG
jgi:GNAT superfamily N-acetyltransferase